MWQIFHKLGSPKWFFGIASTLMPWLLVVGAALLDLTRPEGGWF